MRGRREQCKLSRDHVDVHVQGDDGQIVSCASTNTYGREATQGVGRHQTPDGGRHTVAPACWSQERQQLLPTAGEKMNQELYELSQCPGLVLRFHALKALSKLAKDGSTDHANWSLGTESPRPAECLDWFKSCVVA